MKQYILKSALVAEIEKLEERFTNQDNEFSDGYHFALKLVLSFLDALKVKEVDLEKEIDIWYDKFAINNKFDWNGFAKHFFELGLNAQKGEY